MSANPPKQPSPRSGHFFLGMLAGIVLALAAFSVIAYRSYSAHSIAQKFTYALTQWDFVAANRLCDPKSLKIEGAQSGGMLITLFPNSEREIKYSRERQPASPWVAAGLLHPQYNSFLDFLTGRVTLGKGGIRSGGSLVIRGGQVVYYE